MNVWDLRLARGVETELALPDGWTAALVVLHGTVQVNGHAIARDAQMVVDDRAGTSLIAPAQA